MAKALQKTYARVFHTTRMVPRRVPDLLDNGSIYWVIKRQIRVRQQITDIEEFVDDQGIRRCHLHLDPALVLTRLQARRPFRAGVIWHRKMHRSICRPILK